MPVIPPKRQYGFVAKSGKHVRQGVLGQYALKQGDSQSKQLDDVFAELYGRNGLVEPLYNPERLARLLEINTYHYRACRTKARDTAGLGWSLTPPTEDTSESQADAARTFFDNLDPPLEVVFSRAQLDYEAVGWAAVELIREDYANDKPYVDIVHMPSHTLRVHRDRIRIAQIRGGKTRWFKRVGAEADVHQDTGKIESLGSIDPEFRATEVMWWENYTPRSDYYGLPDIMPGLGALHGDLSRRDYNISFFENHGVPAYAVFVTGEFEEGETDPETGQTELEAAIESHFQELAQHPHSVLVMALPTRAGVEDGNVKVEFHPLSTDVKEASFRLYRKDNRDEILAAHGVPPYRAGIAETGSLGGSTAQESTEIYKQSILDPRQMEIEAMIDRYILVGGFGLEGWRFRFDELDIRDDLRNADLLIKLGKAGAVWPDEIRRHFINRFKLDPDRAVPADLMPDMSGIEAALESLDTLVKAELRKEVARESQNGHAVEVLD